jgi:hypothetical protein
MLSRRLFPTEGQLRDLIVEAVLNRDEILECETQRNSFAAEILRHWQSDPQRDKRNARMRKAMRIEDELAALVATGTPVAEAKRTLASRYGHNSVEALDKWLRRNRLRRRPISSVS